jgi:hypothetical protein
MNDGLEIIIRGGHNQGKTTTANIIAEALREAEYQDVRVIDIPPLPPEQKSRWWERFQKARARSVTIRVELKR